jgi:choice-of-anchor A domain-containing protein
VTGAPLEIGGGPDANTNSIIAAVCGTTNPDPCCTTSSVSPKRWDLACVQLAARHARDTLGLGDVCGRYAWAQGPIAGASQYYPRDFNVFSLGQLNGLRDTEGPVAAATHVNLRYFNLNLGQQQPVALLSGASSTLLSGSVHGTVMYGTSFVDQWVTYVGSSRPTGPTSPFPIDFSAARTKLIAMSQAIKAYDAIAATKQYNTITLAGSDPELNVFSIPQALLTNTFSYAINVPVGSSVIVNVLGANPSLANAGISGFAANMLWNFPDATSLTMTGIGLPGSILAPKAAADLRNGSVAGTVVVGSGSPVNVELYSFPFQIPSSVGARALRVDPTWSMTGNVSDDQTATSFTKEAGFLEIPGATYKAEGQTRTSPTHRIWYSFQPALNQPKTKPLAVFFNGGPGSATSGYLFSFNTSSFTLDPCKVNGAPACNATPGTIAFNPSRWTQFANLLYIDAPGAGFSYPLGNADPATNPSIGTDLDRDAGIFNMAMLRFLLRHPQLWSSKVMIVGESYGGTRATLMLQSLFDYPSLIDAGSLYQDAQVYAAEFIYFLVTMGTGTPSVSQIASKFSSQVLIQPAIIAGAQLDRPTDGTVDQFNRAQNCLPDNVSSDGMGGTRATPCWESAPAIGGFPAVNPTCDPYDCDKPLGFSDNLTFAAATNLNKVNILDQMVGAKVTNVEWMYGRSRQNAYGRLSGDTVATPEMYSTFGSLGPDDRYYLLFNDEANTPYPSASAWHSSGRNAYHTAVFLNRLFNGVSTFITVTKHDTVVWSPDIRYAIENVRLADPVTFAAVKSTSYQPTGNNPFLYPPGTSRPRQGYMQFDVGPASPPTAPPDSSYYVTTPGLYDSGHTVPIRAPAELLADVMDFYARTPQ